MELHPGLLRKTFTERELARILPEVQTSRGAEVADRWACRQSDEVHEQMRQEVTPAIQVLHDWERH